jgi:hypothetical protein
VIDTNPEPLRLIDTESPRIGTDKINPSIQIKPEVVEAGKMIVVTGKGFSGNAELAIILGEHESTSIRAEADGSMRAVLMIPATVGDGSFTLKVTDNKNGLATQNVIVKNSGTLQLTDKEPQQVFDSILAQLEKIQQALNLLLQKVDSSANK